MFVYVAQAFCQVLSGSMGKRKQRKTFFICPKFCGILLRIISNIGNLSERIKISSVQSNCWLVTYHCKRETFLFQPKIHILHGQEKMLRYR